MKTVRLAEVCDVVGGGTPKSTVESFWNGPIAWITPADLSKNPAKHINSTIRTITNSGLESSGAKLLPANSVLLSCRAPIGLVAINSIPIATNQGFKNLVPDATKLDSNFLFWWLKANNAFLNSLGRGATFKEISKSIVQEIRIPLPPIDTQRRISKILDEADGIRVKRQQSLLLLEELAISIFEELFSTSINSQGARESEKWPLKKLKELGKISTGKTPPGSREGMFGSYIPFVTPGDLESGELPKRFLSLEGAETVKTVKEGALLVCCIGTIGKMLLAKEESSFNQQINAIEWFDSINPKYGLFAMRKIKPLMIAKSSATTVPILNKSHFQELMIPVPPIAAQLEFEERLNLIEDQAVKAKKQLDLATELFLSLQERAFKGEL